MGWGRRREKEGSVVNCCKVGGREEPVGRNFELKWAEKRKGMGGECFPFPTLRIGVEIRYSSLSIHGVRPRKL